MRGQTRRVAYLYVFEAVAKLLAGDADRWQDAVEGKRWDSSKGMRGRKGRCFQ
jgi:hypothetical protein